MIHRLGRSARTGRAMSLRALLFLIVLATGLYASAVLVYLGLRLRPAVVEMRREAEPLAFMFGNLSRRVEVLEASVITLRRLTAEGEAPQDSLDAIRTTIAQVSDQRLAGRFGEAPERLRGLLGRTEDALSRLEISISEAVALLELGERTRALERLQVVDGRLRETDEELGAAQREGLADLIAREEALSAAIVNALRVLILILVVGGGLLPVLLLLGHRWIGRPLRNLEDGLARIAEGDLAAQVPVGRNDELGQLSIHFNEMTRVLRQRAWEQGRFVAAGELIAGVAHEVNNPLMAVSAIAQARLGEPHLDPEQRQDLTQILRQARRASRILSGLLRFTRGSDSPADHARLDVVVDDAVALVAHQFQVDEITLDVRLPHGLPPVRGDPARLEQVLVNLMSNAVQALREVPPPRSIVIAGEAAGGRVLLTVRDSGPGVPDEVAARVFHPFFTTKGMQGTGLGLYISRQIVREAGGELRLAEGSAAGGAFVIDLPQARPSEEPVAPSTSDGDGGPPAPLAGARVMIVDDEVSVRQPVARFLRRRGASVVEAGDGREALRTLGETAVDVILADLRMPTMGGVALYRALANDRPHLADRVIFLSGDLTQLTAEGVTGVPPERVLVKPVELEEIEACLARVLDSFH